MSDIKIYSVIFLFIFSVFSIPLHAESWPTTQFKIYAIEPLAAKDMLSESSVVQAMTLKYYKNLFVGKIDYKIAVILEEYIQKVAEDYEKMGFKAPAIDDRARIGGTEAYHIYFYDYHNSKASAFYNMRCEKMETRRYIAIDSSRIFKENGAVNPKVYNDLAHELFHAIQGSYDLFDKNCDLGDWIVEGTATAIGQDMAAKYSNFKIADGEWGMRPYSTPLRVPDLVKGVKENYTSQQGHNTAGLWRYIGEYISNNHNPSSEKKNKPDYHYLTRLFKRKIKKASENNELEWLNRGLKKEPVVATGLNGIYSSFISIFTHYSPGRLTKMASSSWHKCLFSGKNVDCVGNPVQKASTPDPCTEYIIPSEKVIKIKFKIEKVASRCFKLSYERPMQNVNISIQHEVSDVAKLRSLWIGTKILKNNKINFDVKPAGIVEHKTIENRYNRNNRSYIGSWIFELTNTPQVFVISNIAEKPSNTKNDVFTLQIAIPSSKVN